MVRRFSKQTIAALIGVAILITGFFQQFQIARALTQLTNRSDQMSNQSINLVANHLISFQMTDTTDTLASILFQFCSEDPLLGDSCTNPPGFDASDAQLLSQAGNTGFNINYGLSQPNEIVLNRFPQVPTGAQNTYEFSNIHNPGVQGSFFLRIYTYSDQNLAGTNTQFGGLALAVTLQITVNSKVPPYLDFCAGTQIPAYDCSTATGNYLNLGNLTTSNAAAAQSQLLAATNAQGGYSIEYTGTTMTSGNNVITPINTLTRSIPGTDQFGLNLVSNAAPLIGADPDGPGAGQPTANYGVPDHFMFSPNDTIASVNTGDFWRRYTVSYMVNINSGQPAGIYVSTITYVCLANF